MPENIPQTTTSETQKVLVKPPRDAKGRLLPGMSLNPGGKKASGYQDPRTRFNWLSENYTVEQIDAMVMNRKTRRELLYRDAVLLEAMSVSVLKAGKQAEARGYSSEEIIKARHFCIEQMMGKAAMTVRHGGAPEHGPIETSQIPVTAEQALAAFKQAQGMAMTMPEDIAEDAEFTEVSGDDLTETENSATNGA